MPEAPLTNLFMTVPDRVGVHPELIVDSAGQLGQLTDR